MVPFSARGLAAEDYSKLGWSAAFSSLNNHLEETYPYSQWKNIKWNEKYERFAPIVKGAEERNDFPAYYLAVRAYIYSIPDSHIHFTPTLDDPLMHWAVGGYYGIDLVETSNGELVVSSVQGTQAKHLGIRAGDELLQWNGKPAADELRTVSILWARNPAATSEDLRRERLRFLTRGPVSIRASAEFVGKSGVRKNVALQAFDDRYASLERTDWRPSVADQVQAIQSDIYGTTAYLRISALTGLTADASQKVIEKARVALDLFREKGARSLIIDLRKNPGGGDDVASAIASLFSRKGVSLYDQIEMPDKSGTFQLDKASISYTHVTPDNFVVPTVVLVSTGTKSAAEGLAGFLKGQPGITVMGETATAGGIRRR